MNHTRLIALFHRISEAQEAISRMRRFILDLAVRGKLVEQSPDDEPASELLKRIQHEKADLVKTGAISRTKPVVSATANELRFRVPLGWQPARIGQVILEMQTGPFGSSLHQSDYQKGGIPVINPASIKNERLNPVESMAVGPATLERLAAFKLREGDIVMGRRGEMGRCAVVTDREAGWLCGTGSLILRLSGSVFPRFFVMLIGSPLVREYLGGSAVGATMQNLNQSILFGLVIGLPPLAEQHRIVAKVDELMMLSDRLETAQVDREKRRTTLVASSNYHLTDARDTNEFRTHARVFLRHLPELTSRKEDVRLLRETIATLATKGRLAHQEDADEPADKLFERVQAEKARQGISHDGKQFRPDSDVELFAIPPAWRWITLGEIAFEFRYGTSVKCSYEPTGEPVLRIPNVKNGRIDIEDLKFGALAKREADDLRLQLDDILMVRSNGSLNLVGRAALVDAHAVGYCYAGYLVRMRTSPAIYAPYILLALNSAHVRQQIEIPIRTTVGLKNVNATELSRLSLPLPPTAEQRRIVAKVNELIRICDKLELQQSAAITEAGRLLESVLHEALHTIHKREVAAVPELVLCK